MYGLEREKELWSFRSGGKDQHLCKVNHFGSSGSTDASGMLSMFQHSVEVQLAHFTVFLGDGDSKAHKLITEQAVYGDLELPNWNMWAMN